MYLYEAASQAAIKRTGAAHREGVYRMRWVVQPSSPENPAGGEMVYEALAAVQGWVRVSAETAKKNWPAHGWHVGR